MRAFLSLVLLATALTVAAADEPVATAMKLYEKRRYEQAARLVEDARFDGERGAQAHLVLGMIYLRKADLHEAFARTAAAAELDYLDKLSKAADEGRSRYARLYLAEALLSSGNAREAARHFERVRADPGVERNHRALAGIGLGAAHWAQRDPERARKLWSGTEDALEVRLARAAAQGRAKESDPRKLREVADAAAGDKGLSPRGRRYLIEIYLAVGAPEQALAVVRAADLAAPSHVEKFKAAGGTAKTIAFYDLALLTDLAQLYRELARRRLEQAAADPRIKPTAEYYLAEALGALGENDAAAAAAQAFLARPQAPAQYRSRAQAQLALLAYRQGKREEGERALAGMAESSDVEALAAAVLACAGAGAPCPKLLARASQVAEAGDVRRTQRVGFALGTYYLRRHDYARAIAFMEGGRDKSNKNKIEVNDPEMLASLAEAYYRTKKYSEGLEIFFEMSQEFAVVRQIQEAMQAVYSMEQRSAGDVRIL